MNRPALGLAVGAGYLLGRTRKLKLAVAVGTVVAGKKLNLTPAGIGALISGPLRNNPRLGELGDQVRTDMRGVAKAAFGAVVQRRMVALADRLHGRTAEVRDQLTGDASQASGVGSHESEDAKNATDAEDAEVATDAEEPTEYEDEPDQRGRPARKAAPAARKAARTAPAKQSAAKRTQPVKRAVRKKAAGARSAAHPTEDGGGR